MKENENMIFNLAEVEKYVQLIVIEVHAYAEEELDKENNEILKIKIIVKLKLKKKKKYIEYKAWRKRKKNPMQHRVGDNLHQPVEVKSTF